MKDTEEFCESCGCKTQIGTNKEDARNMLINPIFKTDFPKPLSEIIEEVRNRITAARSILSDVKQATVWEDRISEVEGLLTCGISVLYGIKNKILQADQKQKQKVVAGELENTASVKGKEQTEIPAQTEADTLNMPTHVIGNWASKYDHRYIMEDGGNSRYSLWAKDDAEAYEILKEYEPIRYIYFAVIDKRQF